MNTLNELGMNTLNELLGMNTLNQFEINIFNELGMITLNELGINVSG